LVLLLIYYEDYWVAAIYPVTLNHGMINEALINQTPTPEMKTN